MYNFKKDFTEMVDRKIVLIKIVLYKTVLIKTILFIRRIQKKVS